MDAQYRKWEQFAKDVSSDSDSDDDKRGEPVVTKFDGPARVTFGKGETTAEVRPGTTTTTTSSSSTATSTARAKDSPVEITEVDTAAAGSRSSGGGSSSSSSSSPSAGASSRSIRSSSSNSNNNKDNNNNNDNNNRNSGSGSSGLGFKAGSDGSVSTGGGGGGAAAAAPPLPSPATADAPAPQQAAASPSSPSSLPPPPPSSLSSTSSFTANGGVTSTHYWSQTKDEVVVHFFVPPGLRGGKFAKVVVAPKLLQVTLLPGAAPGVVGESQALGGPLAYEVEAPAEHDDVDWDVVDEPVPAPRRLLRVTMRKKPVAQGIVQWWACVFRDDQQKIDVTKIAARQRNNNNGSSGGRSSGASFQEVWQQAHEMFKAKVKTIVKTEVEYDD
jgi:hypothetical protein